MGYKSIYKHSKSNGLDQEFKKIKEDMWRGIHDGWESFSKHVALLVGDGTRILFWHDKWVGDNSLKRLYPQLYARKHGRGTRGAAPASDAVARVSVRVCVFFFFFFLSDSR